MHELRKHQGYEQTHLPCEHLANLENQGSEERQDYECLYAVHSSLPQAKVRVWFTPGTYGAFT